MIITYKILLKPLKGWFLEEIFRLREGQKVELSSAGQIKPLIEMNNNPYITC